MYRFFNALHIIIVRKIYYLKFYVEKPNRLTIGFCSGNVLIMIIDFSGRSLEIVCDESVEFLKTNNITDVLWADRPPGRKRVLGLYQPVRKFSE